VSGLLLVLQAGAFHVRVLQTNKTRCPHHAHARKDETDEADGGFPSLLWIQKRFVVSFISYPFWTISWSSQSISQRCYLQLILQPEDWTSQRWTGSCRWIVRKTSPLTSIVWGELHDTNPEVAFFFSVKLTSVIDSHCCNIGKALLTLIPSEEPMIKQIQVSLLWSFFLLLSSNKKPL